MVTYNVIVSNTTDEIKKKLRLSGISTSMKSLESSEWIVYETENNELVGAAGIGVLFHSSSINVHEKFRGKGYGEDIQKRLIVEAKTKNFSFVTVFVDPRNTASTIMHDKVGYKTIFRIHYSSDIIQDVKIIILKRKGVLVEGFLKLFNTKIGMFCLGCLLKVFRGFFKNIIGYNEQISPIPSLKHIIQNFEKI